MILEELCTTNNEGFVATDVNVGAEHSGKSVLVQMTVVSDSGERTGVSFQTSTEVDKEGFLVEDLFLSDEHPHTQVEVKVFLK